MPVTVLEVGPLGVCCYIVSPEKIDGDKIPCVVIDPGDEAEMISSVIQKMGLSVEAIFLTHAHADHIGAVADMLAAWPEAILACSAETSRRAGDPTLNLSVYLGESITCPPAGRLIADGETFSVACMKWRAVEIPGHDPGELVYITGDDMQVFVGDTLFAGSVGRSDFPGGDGAALISGVRALLESLPDAAIIYPGHGSNSNAGVELRQNPFLTGRMR